MTARFLKALTSRLIGLGIPVPETALSRVQEYRQLKRLLERTQVNCVLDVGADEGQSGRLYRSLGFAGPIHSFEPHSGSYAVLEQETAADPTWWAHRCAVGDSRGRATLKVNLEFPEMNSLLEQADSAAEMEAEQVVLDRLDDVIPDIVESIDSPRLMLKIDAEGYDLHVFRGASASLPLIRALQAEVFVAPIYSGGHHYLEALREYERAGFQLDHLAMVSQTSAGDLMCMNCLMSRRE